MEYTVMIEILKTKELTVETLKTLQESTVIKSTDMFGKYLNSRIQTS